MEKIICPYCEKEITKFEIEYTGTIIDSYSLDREEEEYEFDENLDAYRDEVSDIYCCNCDKSLPERICDQIYDQMKEI